MPITRSSRVGPSQLATADPCLPLSRKTQRCRCRFLLLQTYETAGTRRSRWHFFQSFYSGCNRRRSHHCGRQRDGVDMTGATVTTHANLPKTSWAETNQVSKTSKLPAVETQRAVSGFEIPTPSTSFTGPNQTGPNQTGPNQTGTYQFLEKNPTSTVNPEATASTPGAASTIRAAVNQPNTIVPPQGITYPVASQPAFLASQPAPSVKSQPLAVTTGSPATVSQSPSVSNRSTSGLQPPSYAREAPRPIRLGGQTDQNRQKQQIKIPRQANNQSIAPIAGGIRINPLANRSKLEISHRQASPEDTIQQPKLR
jgi:hypothetical protein